MWRDNEEEGLAVDKAMGGADWDWVRAGVNGVGFWRITILRVRALMHLPSDSDGYREIPTTYPTLGVGANVSHPRAG